MSAMCGIGGGLFAVPVLHYFFGMPLKRSVATALCLVWCVAVSSTLTELLHPDAALFGEVIGLLVLGLVVGTQLGYEVAKRIGTRALKVVFCLLLLLVGWRILSGVGRSGPLAPEAFTLEISDAMTVVGIGLGAGIIVPLLGVGGGLIIVPALLICLPQIGWLGARATSLAAAVVSSTRGLRLYGRDGMVDWNSGAWFGGGAALGAVIGVQLVHLPEGDSVGRVLLGIVLMFASARFGWDLVRRSPQSD